MGAPETSSSILHGLSIARNTQHLPQASEQFCQVSIIISLMIDLALLPQMTRFDAEDMMTNLFFHFDKSTKRKAELVEYCMFCSTEFQQVLKYVSTRWLSLELSVSRTLQQYSALKLYMYFLLEGKDLAVTIRWTGPLDWTTGLDYWTDV